MRLCKNTINISTFQLMYTHIHLYIQSNGRKTIINNNFKARDLSYTSEVLLTGLDCACSKLKGPPQHVPYNIYNIFNLTVQQK
jgi:hypothetical protein